MARKNKVVEPIIGPGKDPENKLTVQKSNPLLSLWRSDMSLAEFKILDTYLSRINSRKPENRTVVFTKGELEQLLGVKKINKANLAARLKSLYRGVEIESSNKKISTVGLFEKADGELDPETGLWTVQLTCTPSAMQYIFNIEKIGYLRYKLHAITKLSSRYAYILFLYLEKNRTMHLSWEEDVDDLRRLLNCDQDESYSAFKVFNDRVLKRCQKELLEKTECRFEYTPIKKGRKVTAVRFTLESIAVAPAPVDEGQLSLFDDSEDPIDVCAKVLPASLKEDQVLSLYMAAQPVAAALFGVNKPTAAQVAAYLQQKVAYMMAYDAKDPIPKKDKYLHAMIANDLPKVDAMKAASAGKAPTPGGAGWQPSLGEAEHENIRRLMGDPELKTVGNNEELAARAVKLKESIQGK